MPAHRTSAGFFQPLPLSEDKAAFPAYRWIDYERMLAFHNGPLDMLKMIIDLSFGNTHVNGNLPRRQRISLKEGYDIPPDRIFPL